MFVASVVTLRFFYGISVWVDVHRVYCATQAAKCIPIYRSQLSTPQLKNSEPRACELLSNTES